MTERGWFGLHTSIWKIASTHVIVDAYTNIYAPLLPLLIPHLNLSLKTAGIVAMCFQMANSVSQLGFGALADRWRPRALVVMGPLLAVIGLSFVGWAHSPLTLGLILVAGGLGGAAFHPPAAALVYKLADHRKGLAMSAHLSGGSLGFSAAPILFAPFIAYMGLQWSPLIMIPGLIALSWTLRQVPAIELPKAHERSTWASLRPAAVPLTLLYFTIVLRTATSYGFMTYAPTLLTHQGLSIAEASSAVSLYLFASGIGGLIGGPLSDRVGPRRVILWSLVAAVPFMAMAPRLPPVGFTAMLAIGGLLLQSTLPISVTFAQTFVKGGAATVSSLMMGFAWGMGSLAVPLIGAGADRFGIEQTLTVLAFIPLLAAALAWWLPRGSGSSGSSGSPGSIGSAAATPALDSGVSL
ncbi:MAG: MFS transporter [Acidobacteriota bacterium]|nr:MFS transporter [Acidobacteriota bacterium]